MQGWLWRLQFAKEITHLPFEAWCETCLATRNRDSERHEKREPPLPVISLGYRFTNTGAGEPALKQLIQPVIAARSAMTLKTSVEYIPQGHSQSAQRAIQRVMRLGKTLLEEVRRGAGLQLPSSHVLFP